MPRATTAACDVAPPFWVSTPSAAIMPWTSSGVVSVRTRIVLRPCSFHATASSAVKTICPAAAPGEALSPLQATSILLVGIDARVEELVERLRVDHADGASLVDQAFVNQIARDFHRGFGGALCVAGLQHEELPALDRELQVLHVAIMALEPRGDLFELCVDLGLQPREIRDLLRRANARNDVFALRVGEVLAEELPLAGVRIARKGDAGPESSPMFPKTISITLTAVPQSSGILLKRR